jgi:hypothetical protein
VQRASGGRSGSLRGNHANGVGDAPHRNRRHSRAAQLFEQPDQRQLFAAEFAELLASELSSSSVQRPSFGRGCTSLILKRRAPGAQHVTDRVPRRLQVPANLLDRLAFDEMLAVSAQSSQRPASPDHPLSSQSEKPAAAIRQEAILDADPGPGGQNLHAG